MRLAALRVLLLVASYPAQAQEPAAPGIADNSFLIEEAYNQEAGVVQHISAYQHSLRVNEWAYSFTQEWPLRGQRHQLSFTLPVQRVPAAGTGFGDVKLNYRYQLLGMTGNVAVSPRVSLVVPTGNEQRGMGTGGWGIETNLPVSMALSGPIVLHGNAGATIIPAARNEAGDEASARAFALGGSVIWLARRTLNVLLEVIWTHADIVTGAGQTLGEQAVFFNPGVRWAHNFKSGLQIVPGVSLPIGLGPASGDRSLFLYVSFEHPLRRAKIP